MERSSRRDFLKLSGLAVGSLAFNRNSPHISDYEDARLARVCTNPVSVHSRPDDTSRIVAQWYRDDLVNIYEEVDSGTPGYNPIWYRVWGGYMHRAHLQRVKISYQKPLTSLPAEGRQLGQVMVPYTQSIRFTDRRGWIPVYRLYYDSVHWITDITDGPDGKIWYILLDELLGVTYNVPASQVRPIPAEEIAPISPGVPFVNKRIEISLSRQRLTAYEYDVPIFEAEISTGIPNADPGDNGSPTITPAGKFNVTTKMTSKHMREGNLAPDSSQSLESTLRRIHPSSPIFHSHYEPTGMVNPDGTFHPLHFLKGKRVVALSGIANPTYFSLLLRRCEAEVLEEMLCPDHHLYTVKDLTSILEKVKEADSVVTTEKDMVKLNRLSLDPLPLLALRIEMKIREEEEFYKRVMEVFEL